MSEINPGRRRLGVTILSEEIKAYRGNVSDLTDDEAATVWDALGILERRLASMPQPSSK